MDDRFDLELHATQRQNSPFALVVMDKIGGWERLLFAADKKPHAQLRLLKFRSMMESANWVCDDALEDHVWVSELTISCQEAHLANPCVVQWGYVVVLGTNKAQLRIFRDVQPSG